MVISVFERLELEFPGFKRVGFLELVPGFAEICERGFRLTGCVERGTRLLECYFFLHFSSRFATIEPWTTQTTKERAMKAKYLLAVLMISLALAGCDLGSSQTDVVYGPDLWNGDQYVGSVVGINSGEVYVWSPSYEAMAVYNIDNVDGQDVYWMKTLVIPRYTSLSCDSEAYAESIGAYSIIGTNCQLQNYPTTNPKGSTPNFCATYLVDRLGKMNQEKIQSEGYLIAASSGAPNETCTTSEYPELSLRHSYEISFPIVLWSPSIK